MIQSQEISRHKARYDVPREVVHGLRTPLNQIIGYSEMLLEQAASKNGDSLMSDLEKIRSAGVNLLTLIEENFDGIEDGELRVMLSPAAAESAFGVDGANVTGDLAHSALILVVDDIEVNRDVLSRRLVLQGYEVATAEGGQQALDMVDAGSYDLILLDIMMPEMDGFSVLERLKSQEATKHIPVIMISALNEFNSVGRCIEMGADDYLPKPFNPILLKARLTSSLEKKRAHDRERALFHALEQSFERLTAAEKMRDDLTQMIIHDLRTPLSSVIAGMQSLEMMGDLNADQTEMKDIAVSGGTTLMGLINDVLDVERSQSGEMDLVYDEIVPGDLVSEAVGQIEALAAARDLALLMKIEIELPRIRGDRNKLVRSLVNLLGNAIKFTPSGGSVTVSVGRSEMEGFVTFSVTDTGEGIPAEAFDRIFDKFGQVESRHEGHSMSTGLGLTFCKAAVEAHGGTIGVRSTPGKGSTLWFSVPAMFAS